MLKLGEILGEPILALGNGKIGAKTLKVPVTKISAPARVIIFSLCKE